ncbi:MAG: hypothetical protein IPK85_03030 [Gemmatimonadetes bacterium]|nr:hypothetical protein [Gemmatimonadota bacterium]
MTNSVRVINPETGVDIFASVYGDQLESVVRIPAPDYVGERPGTVWVQVRPSFRPGMPYDLGSYPESWVHPV